MKIDRTDLLAFILAAVVLSGAMVGVTLYVLSDEPEGIEQTDTDIERNVDDESGVVCYTYSGNISCVQTCQTDELGEQYNGSNVTYGAGLISD